jgi:hypothetical protein
LIDALPIRSERVLVDVYDLVWRAHENDASTAALPLRALRRAYAATVRRRERPALERAGRVVVAGYEDRSLLSAAGLSVHCIPTPTPVGRVPSPDRAADRLRIGLIGNFAHVSTRRGAETVLGSPLARDPGVTVVLAGLDSTSVVAPRRGVEILGPLERVEAFYARVHCVVAPVLGGSGIKVKLGEALCAGRPVVTTAIGAAGYPPQIRRHLALCDHRRLDRATIEQAVAQFDPAAARTDAGHELGWDTAVGRYRAALAEVITATPAG